MSYLIQLKTFVEVYRSGNFTRAASSLNLSQPAVTAHIQSMEAVVGKPLFVRKARGVAPTAIADDLALQVSSHIDMLEQKVASIRSQAVTDHGTLHLAGPAEYLSIVAGPAMANLLQAGKVNLSVHIGNKSQTYQLLQSSECELAITASKPDGAVFEYQQIDQERLLLVMNRLQGNMLKQQVISADILNQYKVVTYDEQLPLIRDYFSAVFGRTCESPVAAVCPDIRAIASLLRAGIGYSVLPDYLCRDAIANGELVQLGDAGPENTIYLVWKKGALRHPRVAFAKDVMLAFANLNAIAQ